MFRHEEDIEPLDHDTAEENASNPQSKYRSKDKKNRIFPRILKLWNGATDNEQ